MPASWSRDEEATFAAEWRALEPMVKAIARRDIDLWRRVARDEEDVCQDAALAICERAAEGQRINSYRGFTCKVVHNRRVDVLRKRRTDTVELSSALSGGTHPVALGDLGAGRDAIRWTRQLSWLQRRILELAVDDGLTRAQIARRLLLTERQVKRNRERACTELRIELAQELDQ